MKRKYYVYRFLNKKGDVIYVGKTNNLNARMSQHKINSSFWKYWYKIEYVEFDNENDQLFYEILMINKYSPIYNTKDKYSTTLKIEDMRKEDWVLFDEIREFSCEELSKLHKKTKEMTGTEIGCLKRSLYDKARYARDEEEREIRFKNYNNFIIMCDLDVDYVPSSDMNTYITSNGGFGIYDYNNHNRGFLFVEKESDVFTIKSQGVLRLTKEQLLYFFANTLYRYELTKEY